MRGLLDLFRERVRTSTLWREAFYKLLKARLINENGLYNYLYSRRQTGVISTHEEFPKTVALESSAYCNSRCIMCPSRKMKRKKGFMSWNTFTAALDECAGRHVEKVYLSGFGEPLLDKHLEDKVAYASSRGVKKSIVTNASLLDRSRALGLIAAGLDEVNVSMDGFSSEVYNKIRVGLDYNTVSENVRGLVAARRNGRPKVIIEMVLLGSNSRDIPLLREQWGSRVDSIVIRQPQDWLKSVALDPGVYTPHRSNGARRARRWSPCIYPFTQLSVYWDGTIPLCHLDYDARGRVGTFGRESLYDIWHGERMMFYKQRHLDHGESLPPPCDRCSYFSVWW